MAEPALIGHLAVIGVGLIGGSAARALKQAGAVDRVTGIGRSRERLAEAVELGVVDAVSTDFEAAGEADVVLVCVPMGAYTGVLSAIAPGLSPRTIVTDAGSTKQHAMLEARRCLPDPGRFVPAHPIAGAEHSGVAASRADLFRDHLCVLTPDAATDADAVATVRDMWSICGCRVEQMSAEEHDDFLAAVSHLPHVLAYALVNAVNREADGRRDPFRFAAGGFRDFTRIASSSPAMWRDIVMSNGKAILAKLDRLEEELAAVREALESGDAERIAAMFASAKEARDAWLKRKGKPA